MNWFSGGGESSLSSDLCRPCAGSAPPGGTRQVRELEQEVVQYRVLAETVVVHLTAPDRLCAVDSTYFPGITLAGPRSVSSDAASQNAAAAVGGSEKPGVTATTRDWRDGSGTPLTSTLPGRIALTERVVTSQLAQARWKSRNARTPIRWFGGEIQPNLDSLATTSTSAPGSSPSAIR